jgi:rhamnogalacturonan endolyase
MKTSFILTILLSVIHYTSPAQHQQKDSTGLTGGTLLYADDFKKNVDTSEWVVEMAPAPNSAVYIRDGNMVLDTKGGLTVWFNHRLRGNLRIEYDRKVIVAGGVNDRLSDLNQFWMSKDPRNARLFTRSGVLESYDSLRLYYVGMGGNSNRTTRFRKYAGNGQRTLIQEYTDTAHLLQANKIYHITIIVNNGNTSYWVNNQCYFSFHDPSPLREGYFGFRSTKSHQEISGFRVYELR